MNQYKPMNNLKVAALSIFAVFFMCSASWAANPYWVDNNGTALWGSCQNATPLSGSSACSLSTANSNARAGDTINMRAGTYSTGIAPANSGSNNTTRITYQNYNDELVTISGPSKAINTNGKNWITVTGSATQNIVITNVGYYLDNASGDYNIIAYITASNNNNSSIWTNFLIGSNASYNWVHHNTISKCGYFSGSKASGNLVTVGYEGTGHSNLIEDNEFFASGHSVVTLYSKYNVLRNNYIHNDPWYSGYGYRSMEIGDRTCNGTSGSMGWNLVEGNRIAFGTAYEQYKTYAEGIQSYAHDIIYRKNMFYANEGPGLRISEWSTMTSCTDNQYIYNNVFFYNGIGGVGSSYQHAIHYHFWYGGSSTSGHRIKNNLFEDNQGGSPDYYYNSSYVSDIVLSNNYLSNSGDPLFTDETVPADKRDDSVPDFTLQESSPAIDGGTYLTQVNDSGGGSGTSLVVDDAHYFFSGDGSPWNIPSYTGISGDYIYVDNSSAADFIVEIASINYGRNTLTLASPQTWDDNAKVYLAVSQTVGFNGIAPDIGAFESGAGSGSGDDGSSVLTPPKDLLIR